ncbi:hypothetical protein K488DRAFT_47457 [Vararia minispora EC-137]|uniref:Uncharacterized protein n=1 Tax=Vararia minispora EC-137 TaxID=1314806 RepID=A0ACB8QPR8_9AGAM|nr:hypothetical protein K488DRAFT_47457 [Vararia minispora EC-137]
MTVATVTAPDVVQLMPSTSKSASTTLRSLYPRAARAFLHRDICLTHSLVTTAFALLTMAPTAHDALHEQRRKWEILRITLEVTVYATPPEDSAAIPAPLRSNAMQSGPSLITSQHKRSLELFTPASALKPDASFLPAPVLVTLAAASVRVHAPDVGRLMVEEWLARRDQTLYGTIDQGEDGYEKVIDVYCTNVLPALDEWEYAAEFLQYESELGRSSKEVRLYLFRIRTRTS